MLCILSVPWISKPGLPIIFGSEIDLFERNKVHKYRRRNSNMHSKPVKLRRYHIHWKNNLNNFKFNSIQIQKRFIETHIHIQKWYIKFLCHSTESDSSLRYIISTLHNMWINEGRQKPGSLYGPHYVAWSIPDSDITRANVDTAWDGGTQAGPTLGQVTPSSGSRILYWSYDVALVVKATASANKTRVQLGSRWMIIKPFKDGKKTRPVRDRICNFNECCSNDKSIFKTVFM